MATVYSIAPGAEVSCCDALTFTISTSTNLWAVNAITKQPEANPADNIVFGCYATDGRDFITFTPAELHPGSTAQFDAYGDGLTSASRISSSNSAVVSIGAVQFTADPKPHLSATITALAAGKSKISVENLSSTVDATVLAAGSPLRFPIELSEGAASQISTGRIVPLSLRAASTTSFSTAVPTGTVSISEGAQVIDSQPLTNGGALLQYDPGTAGNRDVTYSYSGDLHYEPFTSTFRWYVPSGIPAAHVGRKLLPDGRMELEITISGTPRATPAGTAKLYFDATNVYFPFPTYVPLAPVSPGTISGKTIVQLTPGRHDLLLMLDGQANFLPVELKVPLYDREHAVSH